MRKGFTVIEILISMMVLFVAIAFVNISIKSFNNYQKKSEKYQDFYITALSLKDWINTQNLTIQKYEGKMNGINYELKIQLLVEEKTRSFSVEKGFENNGAYMISLYQVNMLLIKGTKREKFQFFLTKQISLQNYSKEE